MSGSGTGAVSAGTLAQPVPEAVARTAAPAQRAVRSERLLFWRRLLQARLAPTALFLIVLLVLAAVFADVITPYDPLKQNLAKSLEPPSATNWFGTDELGRDVLSRIVSGARISLMVGVVAVGIAAAVGTTLGLIAGYTASSSLEMVIMRLMDALLSFPSVVLALAITALLGPSIRNAMIAIGIVGVPIFAWLVRGQVLTVRKQEYVEAARVIGSSHLRIVARHLLPNIVSAIVVLASLRVAQAILAEATLSFLGLGVQPPTPTWGTMLANGRAELNTAPWVSVAPGMALFLVVLAFNILGDAVRDALDPRLKV